MITVDCSGEGEMRCVTNLDSPIKHDNGNIVSNPEYALFNDLEAYADNQIVKGALSGSKIESISVGYPSGVVVTYQYKITWTSKNGQSHILIEEV